MFSCFLGSFVLFHYFPQRLPWFDRTPAVAADVQTNLKIYVREAEARDPRFDQLHYRFAVPENKAGVLVGRVELKPRKFRVNSQMIYSIINTEMRSVFNITAVRQLRSLLLSDG